MERLSLIATLVFSTLTLARSSFLATIGILLLLLALLLAWLLDGSWFMLVALVAIGFACRCFLSALAPFADQRAIKAFTDRDPTK